MSNDIITSLVNKKNFALSAINYTTEKLEIAYPNDGLVTYPVTYLGISKKIHADGVWRPTNHSTIEFAWMALPEDIYRRGIAIFIADDDYDETLDGHWEVGFYLDPIN